MRDLGADPTLPLTYHCRLPPLAGPPRQPPQSIGLLWVGGSGRREEEFPSFSSPSSSFLSCTHTSDLHAKEELLQEGSSEETPSIKLTSILLHLTVKATQPDPHLQLGPLGSACSLSSDVRAGRDIKCCVTQRAHHLKTRLLSHSNAV